MQISSLAILFGLLVFVSASSYGQNSEAYDVVYRQVDGKELQLDLVRPSPAGTAKPAIIFLCGNSWGYDRTINRGAFSYALDVAAAHGYVAVTVDYSSTLANNNGRPMGVFPAQLYDVKSAVRYLRDNAENLDIDPTRIGVLGFSSGGIWL